jgi:hypothetical protein
VTLLEASPALGGQVLAAARGPQREDYAQIAGWLAGQVHQAGVEVRLNAPARVADVLERQPEAVVIATGATPRVPEIPGVGLPHVATAVDILMGRVSPARTGCARSSSTFAARGLRSIRRSSRRTCTASLSRCETIRTVSWPRSPYLARPFGSRARRWRSTCRDSAGPRPRSASDSASRTATTRAGTRWPSSGHRLRPVRGSSP